MNGYPRFWWVDILRFHQTIKAPEIPSLVQKLVKAIRIFSDKVFLFLTILIIFSKFLKELINGRTAYQLAHTNTHLPRINHQALNFAFGILTFKVIHSSSKNSCFSLFFCFILCNIPINNIVLFQIISMRLGFHVGINNLEPIRHRHCRIFFSKSLYAFFFQKKYRDTIVY